MSLKRPAETPLVAEGRGGFAPPDRDASANPFAGVSLSLSGPLAGSLFASAAKGVTSNSFAFTTPAAKEVTFATAAASNGAGKPANPFAGLSLSLAQPAGGASGDGAKSASSGGGLFSSAASSLSSPASGGGLFSSAASSLSSPASGGGLFSAAANSLATPAAGGLFSAAASGATGGLGFGGAGEKPAAKEKEATGEEGEEVVFQAECKLYRLVKQGESQEAEAGAATQAVPAAEKGWRWQERGGGTLHINRSAKSSGIRFVMRTRGVLKLVLNTPVFPTTKYEKVGQKSVTFMGIDTEEPASDKVAFCSYRLNLLSSDQQGKFLAKLHELLNLEKCK